MQRERAGEERRGRREAAQGIGAVGSRCCGGGEGGHSQRSSSQTRRRPQGTWGASGPQHAPCQRWRIPAVQRGPASMAKMCREASPCSAQQGASHCPQSRDEMGRSKSVSRCPEPLGTPAPCPWLCAGHRLSKRGTITSPGEPSAPGPRAAPRRSQAFPNDNQNQRLLRFAWNELRGLRGGPGGAGGHGLRQGRREGSSRMQGCSALGSQRAGQA